MPHDTIPSIDDYARDINAAISFENVILYRMCRDQPKHDDAKVVSGKMILIGRTYAASPERAIKAKDSRRDQNTFEVLAKALCKSDLDRWLDDIPLHDRFNEAMLERVIEVHDALVGKIDQSLRTITTKSPKIQRSFCSKYLHFHRPNAFPIMDSLALKGLKLSLPKSARPKSEKRHELTDRDYATFCERWLRFVQKNPSIAGSPWTPRTIDHYLVGKGRAADREKHQATS
jgi:hypothetical protein